MSEPSKELPVVRLLEPRAVMAADRLTQRMSDRALPLLRTLSAGASRFSERMFDHWVGRADNRPPMGSAMRGPQSLDFPVPWYEQPRAAWPAGGIVLSMPVLAGDGARSGMASAAPRSDLRVFVAPGLAAPESASVRTEVRSVPSSVQLPAAPAAAPQTPAAASPSTAAAVSATADFVAGAALASGEEPRALALVRAYQPEGRPALVPAAVTSRAAGGEPARLVAPGLASPRILSASIPQPSLPRPSLASRLIDRLTSVDSLLRTTLGPIAPSIDANVAASDSRGSARAARAPSPTFVAGGDLGNGDSGLDTLRPRGPVPVDDIRTAIAAASSVVLAGPGAPLRVPELASVAAPSPALMRSPELGAPVALRFSPALVAPVALAWPRLQRFVEYLAGPTTLAQAGVVDAAPAPRTAAVFSRELVTSVDGRPAVSTVATGTAARALAPRSSVAPLRFEGGPSPSGTAPVTLLGELVRASAAHAAAGPQSERSSAQSAWRPGRLAQNAELLATVAEQRVAHQLGVPSESASPRSVRWSADAFTIVESFPEGSRAGAAVRRMEPARAPMAAPASGVPADTRVAQRTADGPGPAASPATASGTARSLLLGSALVAPGLDSVVRVARPASIASLIEFADSQLGPRLLGATNPLPIRGPAPVYLSAAEPASSGPVRVSPPLTVSMTAASRTSVADRPLRGLAGTFAPWLGAPGLGADSFVTAFPERVDVGATERPQHSAEEIRRSQPSGLPVSADMSVAQVGRRSEQLAAELGIRVGSLASEFLLDVVPDEDGQPALPEAAPRGRRPAMSTNEWVLLSLFPSLTTANQVALSISDRAISDRAVSDRVAQASASSATAERAPAGRSGLRAVSLPPLTLPGAGMSPASRELGSRFGQPAAGGMGHAAERGFGFIPAVLESDDATNDAPVSAAAMRAPLTALLPDGRRPRGSRLVARSAMTTVGGGPAGSAAVHAGSEAASRRVESPVGAPLWNHLRPAAAEQMPQVRGEAGGPRAAIGSPRAAALDLVAPFIENARPEGGAASFAREALPVVAAAGGPPDDSTKSLVTALSAVSSQSGSDRLSLGDLTLISIVSAADQVAASAQGAAPDLAAPQSAGVGSTGRGAEGDRGNDRDEIDRIARLALKALEKAARLRASRGGG